MIDKIIRIDEKNYVVVYTNRGALTVYADNGEALSLVEQLLSPRPDMGYSEYLKLLEFEDDDTEPFFKVKSA